MKKKCEDCKWFSCSRVQCRVPLLIRLFASDATLHENGKETYPEECSLFDPKQKVKEAANVQDED